MNQMSKDEINILIHALGDQKCDKCGKTMNSTRDYYVENNPETKEIYCKDCSEGATASKQRASKIRVTTLPNMEVMNELDRMGISGDVDSKTQTLVLNVDDAYMNDVKKLLDKNKLAYEMAKKECKKANKEKARTFSPFEQTVDKEIAEMVEDGMPYDVAKISEILAMKQLVGVSDKFIKERYNYWKQVEKDM